MVKSYKVEKFDGENWETHIVTTDIHERSKL